MTSQPPTPDPSPSRALDASLARALDARRPLIASLEAEHTDCYRLFHGTVEGRPGLTIDRYGATLLVQSFHSGLDADDLASIDRFYAAAHPVFEERVYNDRSAAHSRVRNASDDPSGTSGPSAARVIHERGVRYRFRARHRGHDPFLFLDLRAARRYVASVAAGRTVLNLFAYTCGVGTSAAVAGASRVLNVDFARSSLDVGRENAALNGVEPACSFLESDFFAAARQLAGLGAPKARRHQRLPSVPRVEPEAFDIVFLDPPRYAKSVFGVVDLVHDYGGVFKPSLLATREGGTLVCCNNVARVDADEWVNALTNGVRRHGRTLRGIELLRPDPDFPSSDDNPPLKVAVLSV